MANDDHLKILKQGGKIWNQWRIDNPVLIPDLSFSELSEQSFTDVNFSNTNFHSAILNGWKTDSCNFKEANLTQVGAQSSYWRNSQFNGAEISGGFLGTNFYIADLANATVQNCGFPFSALRFLKLNKTQFSPHFFDTDINSWTIRNSDLSGMRSPQNAGVEYYCNIDFETLIKTANSLREKGVSATGFCKFFEDCGLPNEMIDAFSSWAKIKSTTSELISKSDDFFSCFISYSQEDRSFVQILHERLKTQGIQCWLDEDKVLPGDDIYDSIDQGIRYWDKVLFCCSQNSLNTPWVDREIDKALQKEENLWRERKEKVLIVIPLNLDGFLFNWNSGKASALQSRLAADFVDWESNKPKFESQVEKLILALRADRKLQIPESKL